MTRSRRWAPFAPGMLVLLSLVPAAAGVSRLFDLAGNGPVTEANARFVASPLPVVVHILAVLPYSILGALQVAPAVRRRWPAWHRTAGRYLAVLGLTAALTGLWMARFYPWPTGDGEVLYLLRLGFGSAMILSILLGASAARRRDFASHGAWMLRAYAIGMGAATQVLTHLPWIVLGARPGDLGRAIAMGAGWAVNLLVAELIIQRGRRRAALGPRIA